MSRCELTGKGPVNKNLVSHSNIKTKSKAMPNIQVKRFYSDTLKEFIKLKVATSTIRSLEHSGGFDKYLLNQDADRLSKRAQAVANRVRRKLRSKTAAKA